MSRNPRNKIEPSELTANTAASTAASAAARSTAAEPVSESGSAAEAVAAAAARSDDSGSGRFSYDGLESPFHTRARLGIVTSLAGSPNGLVFGELKELCALTDGNLSRHLTVLAEGGLVEIWKGTRNNRPQTLVRLTVKGRQQFQEYINVLESVVADAVAAASGRLPRGAGGASSAAGADGSAAMLTGKLASA